MTSPSHDAHASALAPFRVRSFRFQWPAYAGPCYYIVVVGAQPHGRNEPAKRGEPVLRIGRGSNGPQDRDQEREHDMKLKLAVLAAGFFVTTVFAASEKTFKSAPVADESAKKQDTYLLARKTGSDRRERRKR